MAKPLRLQKGDRVTLRLDGDEVEGIVDLASGNGCSLFVSFDGLLGPYGGGIPLMWCDGEYSEIVGGRVVQVTRWAQA